MCIYSAVIFKFNNQKELNCIVKYDSPALRHGCCYCGAFSSNVPFPLFFGLLIGQRVQALPDSLCTRLDMVEIILQHRVYTGIYLFIYFARGQKKLFFKNTHILVDKAWGHFSLLTCAKNKIFQVHELKEHISVFFCFI